MKMNPHKFASLHKAVFCALLAIWLAAPIILLSQPSSDAVFQRLVHEYTLHKDGSIDYHHFRQLKINSYYAFHRKYGETFIVYNSDYEKVTINEAFTVMADGLRVPLPDNAINDVLPRNAEGAPAYNSLREKVITHTGLENGATIYLDYTLKRFPGKMPFFAGAEILAEEASVTELTLILRVPDEIPLFHKMLNAEMDAEVTQRNGMTEYRWDLHNVPARSSLPYQASPFYSYPAILYSTARDMETAWSVLLVQPAFKCDASADIKMCADSIRNTHKDGLQLSLALQEYVSAGIKTWPIGLTETGFQVRTAEETWNAAGGTPLEKAILLATICRAAGLNAIPYMTIERVLLDKGIGIPQAFSHPLVRVALKDRMVFLDPIKPGKFSEELALVNQYLLPMDPDEKKIEQPAPDLTSKINLQVNMEFLAEKGITGKATLVTSQAACPEFALIQGKNAWEIIGNFPAYAHLNTLPTAKNGNVCEQSFEFKNENELKQYQNYIFIPWPSPSISHHLLQTRPLTSSESVPSILRSGIELEYSYELRIPEGFRLVNHANKTELTFEAGSFSTSLQHQKGKVVFKKSLKLSSITVKDREGFVELVNQWLSPNLQGIYLVENK